ncbi:MAG: glycosyltransferase family 2 protein [Methanosphaera stadtmanae]|nr:glycosyltransferase family 2 protein [Methanosphaera stadtmanae]
MEVTVIIPNYNNVKLLDNLLISLKKSDTPFKTVIVDNNSKDNSVELIKQKYPEVNLIENEVNKGFAKAVNQAIRVSDTKYVFLLNNDTTVCPNTISALLKTIKRDEKIFSVTSKMIQYHDKNLIDDAGDEYTLLSWSKKIGYNHDISEYNEDREVFGACAGAALYNRQYFDIIGLFDEDFESYVEDMDLNFRARIQGYKSYYSSNAIVYHYGSATTGSRYNEFKVKISARNNIYLIYKNMPLWMKILNFPFYSLGMIIKYIFFIKKGYGHQYKSGISEGIKTRKDISVTENKNTRNLLKIELQMIINTFKYPF